MALNDFADFFKSVMCLFKSMLNSLDLPILMFVTESNGYIKQALFKWAQLSTVIRFTHKKVSGHASKKI